MSLSGDLPTPQLVDTQPGRAPLAPIAPDVPAAVTPAANSLEELTGQPKSPEPLFDYDAIANHFGVPVDQARGMIEGMVTAANRVALGLAAFDVRRREDIAPYEGLKAILLATKLAQDAVMGERTGNSMGISVNIQDVLKDPGKLLPTIKQRVGGVISGVRNRDFKGTVESIYLAGNDAVEATVGHAERGWDETMKSRFGPAFNAQFGRQLTEVIGQDMLASGRAISM